MFDTMTMTKTVGAVCGSLLVFLLGAQIKHQRAHRGGVGLEVRRAGVELGVENGHTLWLFQAVFCSSRPSWSFISSRILNFWILPVTVIGKLVTKRM